MMPAMNANRQLPLWLFPVAFLIHVTEEFFGGAGLSLAPHRMRGFNLTPLQFIVGNCVVLVLILVGLAFAWRIGFPHLLLLVLGSVFLVNGLLHVLTALRTSAYTPGLITSPLVFIPLGSYTLYRLWGAMSRARYCTGLALGGGVHLCVSLLAHNGRTLFGS